LLVSNSTRYDLRYFKGLGAFSSDISVSAGGIWAPLRDFGARVSDLENSVPGRFIAVSDKIFVRALNLFLESKILFDSTIDRHALASHTI
jgi:hypothetical protein